jgi:hypothetical protein
VGVKVTHSTIIIATLHRMEYVNQISTQDYPFPICFSMGNFTPGKRYVLKLYELSKYRNSDDARTTINTITGSITHIDFDLLAQRKRKLHRA